MSGHPTGFADVAATVPAQSRPVRPLRTDRTATTSADEVLQLAVVHNDGNVTTWIETVIDIASRTDGFIGARTLRSADGGWVVVGLRWRNVETMAAAAITSAALHRSATDHRREPMVFFLDSDEEMSSLPVDAITTPTTG